LLPIFHCRSINSVFIQQRFCKGFCCSVNKIKRGIITLCAKQINVLVAFGLPVMPVTSLTICLLPVFHRGSIIHGTTFRALKVTSQVATTGAESAVCDWFCACAQPLRRRIIHRQIDPRDATAVSSSTFRNAETMTRERRRPTRKAR